jgi:hypothetical protein
MGWRRIQSQGGSLRDAFTLDNNSKVVSKKRQEIGLIMCKNFKKNVSVKNNISIILCC